MRNVAAADKEGPSSSFHPLALSWRRLLRGKKRRETFLSPSIQHHFFSFFRVKARPPRKVPPAPNGRRRLLLRLSFLHRLSRPFFAAVAGFISLAPHPPPSRAGRPASIHSTGKGARPDRRRRRQQRKEEEATSGRNCRPPQSKSITHARTDGRRRRRRRRDV